jgi:uncharacterized protein YcbK (DUF882 family)|tara:strand:- start:446 stop:1027 length:582 start_codon:yes stop_codon:yes gene_type:complete
LILQKPTTRRQFIKGAAQACLAALFAGAFPDGATGADWRQVALDRDRWLSLERASTGEKATFLYYRFGRGFDPEGYLTACHLLRDVKSGVAYRMNPKLIDLLYIIQIWLRANRQPFHIIIQSGYRTPEYNRTLANAARNSEHVNGNAADIRIPGVDIATLNRLALAIGVGGVGIYPNNGFVHVDVGRVRQWQG